MATDEHLSRKTQASAGANSTMTVIRIERSVLRRQCSCRYKSKYEKVGVLPIQIVKSNVSSIGPLSERNLK